MSVSEFLPSVSSDVKAKVSGTSSRKRWVLIGLGIVLLMVLGWYGYKLLFPSKPRTPPPAPVRTAIASKKNVTVLQSTIGTVVSPDMLQVTAQVQGKLLTANFQEGQLVHKGDPLFLIDPAPFEAALTQAKGQLAKDQATLAGARSDLARYEALMAANAISKQTVDDERATVQTDEGVVQSDQGNVQSAQINLGYTRIVSPIDGKTGPIQIQPGNVITVAGATPLVTVTQIQPIKLSFFVPQNELTQIQNQMTAGKLMAVVPMPGAPGGQESAPVDFISNMVGANTGTIELRATFANADQRLVPGQNVNVGFTLRQIAGATVVPRDAVNIGPDSSYVYVVGPGNVVSSKTVTLLNDDGVNDAVKGDVKPGDQVVVEGQLRIVPGSKVAIRNGRKRAPQPTSDMPS